MDIKCKHCEKEIFLICNWSSYAYKLKRKTGKKFDYFCSYSCMQKEHKENQEAYNFKRRWDSF